MDELHLYVVAFIHGNVQRVAVLHAADEQDALYCIRENWKRISKVNVTRIDTLHVGHIVTVYQSE